MSSDKSSIGYEIVSRWVEYLHDERGINYEDFEELEYIINEKFARCEQNTEVGDQSV